MTADGTIRVGMDLTFMGLQAGGLGRYVCELIPALLEQQPLIRLTAFVGRHAPAELFRTSCSDAIHWVRLPLRPTGTIAHRISQRMILPGLARALRLDVFHNPATLGPIRIKGIPVVATLLDLIWVDFPKTQSKAILSCAHGADRILTASNTVADAITEVLEIPRERIDKAPLGVRPPTPDSLPHPDDIRRRYDLGVEPVILCVAQKRPYKNLDTLIKALSRPETPGILVFPGSPSPYEQTLRTLAANLGITHRIRFLDWVSETELEWLYRVASCLVLPSFNEGFGLPVLEAMIRSVPVACSNRWALPETAGTAALLFDPEDTVAVAQAIRRLITDQELANDLIKRGRRRAEAFTWHNTARMTADCYRRALRESHGTKE